jgi:hypothetical protein
MWPFVERLAAFDPPDRVFVASGGRRYQGEKFTLSSRAGLRPDTVPRLIARLKSLPGHKKPLLVLDGDCVSPFAQATHYTYAWDGSSITNVIE